MLKLSPAPAFPDLLTLLPVGVLLMTRDLTVTYANMAAENVLGESAPLPAQAQILRAVSSAGKTPHADRDFLPARRAA